MVAYIIASAHHSINPSAGSARGVCLAPRGLLAPQAYQVPAAFEALAVESECQISTSQIALGITRGLPSASVPQHNGAAAILILRNRSFEGAVVKRMVLDMHSEALVCGVEARTPSDRPALQNTAELPADPRACGRTRRLCEKPASRMSACSMFGVWCALASGASVAIHPITITNLGNIRPVRHRSLRPDMILKHAMCESRSECALDLNPTPMSREMS
jgi:hypothetical protein